MAKLAECGKRTKSTDDVDKMWTVLEKHAGGKTSEELSPMDPYKRDLLYVDKEW